MLPSPLRARWPLAALALLVAIEQGRHVASYDKLQVRQRVAALVERIDDRCETFYVSTVGKRRDLTVHEDAMWAAMATGVATVNGRYGNHPPGWNLRRRHRLPGDVNRRQATSNAIERWIAYNCLDPAKVCWIELETPLGARPRVRAARWLLPAARRCSGS